MACHLILREEECGRLKKVLQAEPSGQLSRNWPVDIESRVNEDKNAASQMEALEKFAEARGTEITGLQTQLDFCFLEFAPDRASEDKGG